MSWTAEPGDPPDFADYRDDLAIVPDVKSFPDAVASLNLADGGYKLEISDSGNPFLEEATDSDVESEDGESPDGQGDEIKDSWSLGTQDASERKLAALVKPEEVELTEAQFAYGVDHCDVCGGSLDGRALFVDGALKEQSGWANMCAKCFLCKGAGIGLRSGQLYAKQPNGDWRMVAGFDPAQGLDESDDDH